MYTYEKYLSRMDGASFDSIILSYLPLAAILFLVTLLCMAVYFYRDKKPFDWSAFLFMVFCLFMTMVTCLSIGALLVSKRETNAIYRDFKANVPLGWKETTRESLVSFGIEKTQEIEGSGSVFVYQVSSTKSIDYQYIVETEHGYQHRFLSDDWNFSKDQIFIKENNSINPCFIVEKYGYEDDRFESVFVNNSIFDLFTSSNDLRCTFVVPVGTVLADFPFN